MKTTVLIDDDVYRALVREAVAQFGRAKNISAVLNQVLRKTLLPSRPKSMFGTMKRVSLRDLRDERDRFD